MRLGLALATVCFVAVEPALAASTACSDPDSLSHPLLGLFVLLGAATVMLVLVRRVRVRHLMGVIFSRVLSGACFL